MARPLSGSIARRSPCGAIALLAAASLAAFPAAGAPESGGIAAVATRRPTTVAVLPPATLHYQVTARYRGITLHSHAHLAWRHDGRTYQALLELATPLRTRTQRSEGRITAKGLAPIRFSDRNRTEQTTHFAHDRGQVIFSGNQPAARLEPGAQDRLSVLLQLASMIAGDPAAYPPRTAIRIQTAGTRDAEPWTFVVAGPEPLQLPGADLTALKLTREPRREGDVRVELWLAPAHAYAPVRLRLTQPDGDWVDQQWSSTDRN